MKRAMLACVLVLCGGLAEAQIGVSCGGSTTFCSVPPNEVSCADDFFGGNVFQCGADPILSLEREIVVGQQLAGGYGQSLFKANAIATD